MSQRGPYKRYEHDPTASIPKTTLYNKRKRDCAKNIEPEDCSTIDDLLNAYSTDEEENSEFQVQNVNKDQGSLDDEVESEDDQQFNSGMEGISGGMNDWSEPLILIPSIILISNNGNDPIYPGSNVTKAQSLLLILCFVLRHKLTDVALGDLLLLLNTFFPNTVPPTKYRFYKSFQLEQSEKHFYCSNCSSYLGKNTAITLCKSCDSPFNEADSIKKGDYFVYIPLQKQIETTLSNAKLHTHLTNRKIEDSINSSVVSDITTSALYKELISEHSFSSNDISLTWNTDGIPVFNSSNFSIWPLQAFINELPSHLRSKNILLLGLWFGQKPNMNIFLIPFVEECRKLETEGFVFGNELHRRRVFALLLSADSPARAIVRNVKQFNGEYGCDWCEFEGLPVATTGPPVRYYPYRMPVVMRSARKQAAYALQSTAAKPVKGVKGVSVADMLPSFDTVRGTITDYMHSVCLGVMRQMVDLWFNSKNHGESYYIGRQVKLVDERLQVISPPSEIHRSPRSISQRQFWKASEWRAFIFYSLIVYQ
ncbi:uncharacterized protein LOC114540149 [Dendronephthya gigantea]|uniref:uncharacterized protein LOC114540149 n=1 Tax=Dendronephthya gigantea TaxID=151771 RepID=UPI00106BD7E8|nr:uncharacterized protein LOC114540149 [Dendronephthya gigantea]